ncbi:type 1 glutamine amidotransferase [Halorarum salinum]|uniref:Gamma-glutamyl-gamma-aminobutyrate hydrolase family protein n=1 Tax=Halorarum salinum TaxID=2743089 RepID=A0A7D5L8P0_9EURY|nr:type 1 glutamine amidotransferase [Halobaculum salinum]QLG60628.1 gamma-glutamyl-gamma-aminobutyrate hydrolase family protein [Halobaculum salinum]
MTRLRFALLNAAHADANTTRNFRRELDADLAEFDANAGHLPDHFDWDGVVITGSRSSVYWDEEWIPPLVEWTAEAAERGLPILGVCYGHQVLADALGGRVAGMDEFEIGYSRIEHLGNDDLFEGIDGEFTAFTTHGDAVVDLPPGAKLVAENEFGVHAFRKGNAWGVQFHPEYDTDTAREVTEGKRERIGDAKVDAVLAGITPENYDAACEAKTLFDNFTSYARRVREERAAGADVEA